MAKARWLQGDGAFQRKSSEFRDRIQNDPGARFAPEPGRYHLYVSYACPWAHRTLLTRNLLDLQDAISFDVVDWHMQSDGSWVFPGHHEHPEVPDHVAGATHDSLHGADGMQDVYRRADPGFAGIGTVPVLWDKKEQTIVNNESREIVRMLDTAFSDNASRSLLPEGLEAEVDAMIDANYESVQNGVYKCGFARAQGPFEEAYEALFSRLDALDAHLEGRDWLVGPGRGVLSEADVCLWPTLLRFDAVYHTHFKCNRNRIRDLPNVWALVNRLYQEPGVAETVHWDHIRNHYYWSHTSINPFRIVPPGPRMDLA